MLGLCLFSAGDASENCIEVGPDGEVVVMGAGNRSDKRKNFKFDKVFGTKSGQEEVYGESQPLIRSVLDGRWISAMKPSWSWVKPPRTLVTAFEIFRT